MTDAPLESDATLVEPGTELPTVRYIREHVATDHATQTVRRENFMRLLAECDAHIEVLVRIARAVDLKL